MECIKIYTLLGIFMHVETSILCLLQNWKKINIYIYAAAAAAKSLQLGLTLCNAIEGSPLGSSVPGILQARILEWVAISFSMVLPNT